MATPLDVVTAFHNAFRRDITGIDVAALAFARGNTAVTPTIERFRFLNEVLVWHADGEEKGVFPILETVAPDVAEAYVQDHRALDTAFDALNTAYSAGDRLETARASAAFKFHLDVHLAKEDTHLYRLFGDRTSPSDQAKAVGIAAGVAPRERFPEVVAWMFPLLGDDDRENMTRIWQQMNPPEVFAGAAGLIHRAIGDDWAELERRIPELATLS